MVDQKSVTPEVQPQDEPASPSRRKLLIGVGAGATLAAFGGVFWLGRNSGENAPEATPTSTPGNQDTLAPTTVPGSEDTLAPATTEAVNNPESLAVPLEILPTSLEDPHKWVEQIYGLLDTVYNEHQYELLDYVYYNGLAGNLGEQRRYDAEIARIKKTDDATNDELVITGTLLPHRTSIDTNGAFIGVEEHIQFKDQDITKTMDYTIIAKDLFIKTENGSENIRLYLINSVATS